MLARGQRERCSRLYLPLPLWYVWLVQVAVVRRGEAETYETLAETFGVCRRPLVEIIWDRRHGDRRRQEQPTSLERRCRDRRGPQPLTWSALGFVMLPSLETMTG